MTAREPACSRENWKEVGLSGRAWKGALLRSHRRSCLIFCQESTGAIPRKPGVRRGCEPVLPLKLLGNLIQWRHVIGAVLAAFGPCQRPGRAAGRTRGAAAQRGRAGCGGRRRRPCEGEVIQHRSADRVSAIADRQTRAREAWPTP